MKTIITILTVVLFSCSSLVAQEAKPMTGDAVKVAKHRGEDPEIKSDETNSADYKGKVIGPDGKGTASRGGSCFVNFDNYTYWVIKCYVDGIYEGTVGRRGDGGVYVSPGRTKFYAVADFDDGSRISWGPGIENCSSGQTFDVKLWEDFFRANIHY